MRWSRSFALVLMVLLLSGSVSIVAPLAPGHPARHVGYAKDGNDHSAMYGGGVPEWGQREGQLQANTVCEDIFDSDTNEVIAQGCLQVNGLGSGPENRSYTEEEPNDLTVAATNDGDPVTGHPLCIPDDPWVNEVGIYAYDPDVMQFHSYGAPVATGPRGPPVKDGCARWHAQTLARDIGGLINQVGIDGIGRRARVALMHKLVVETPNPCYGKPCDQGRFIGKRLHFEGTFIVFEIAPSRSQKIETWYLKQFTPQGKDRHLGGHTFGQTRIPLLAEWFRLADGTATLGIATSPNDGAGIPWDTCGNRGALRKAGWEGVPCVKSNVSMGKGSGGVGGRSYYNPNVIPIPSDEFGNRLVPLSIPWIRCPDRVAGIPMPNIVDGDGKPLNGHQWQTSQPQVIQGYMPPECMVSLGEAGFRAMLNWPSDGFKGWRDTGPPAPTPTGIPNDPTPTVAPPATATEQAKPRIVALPVDTKHWWATDQYDVEAKPAPDVIQEGLDERLDYRFGGDAPVAGLPADRWSAVFYGTWPAVDIEALRVRCDDDCRLVFNEEVAWQGPSYATTEFTFLHIGSGTGPVPFRLEMREATGDAYARVEAVLPGAVAPEPTIAPSATPEPATATPEPTAEPVPTEPAATPTTDAEPTATATPDDVPPAATPNESTTMRLIGRDPLILANAHYEWIPRSDCRGGATKITDGPWSFNYAADRLPHGMPPVFCILARTHIEVQRGRALDRIIVRSDDGIKVWVRHQLVYDGLADPPYAERVIERMPDGRPLREVFNGYANHEVNIEFHNNGGRALSWLYVESD